jgi:hypothetical protein
MRKKMVGLGYIYNLGWLKLHDSNTKVSLKADFSWSIALQSPHNLRIVGVWMHLP